METIDKTIKHLKGKKKMKDKEIFEGFGISQVLQANLAAEEIVGKSVKNPTKSVIDVEKRGKAFYESISKTAHGLFKELVRCIEQGKDPASVEVQRIIKKHHAFVEEHQKATIEVYKAMSELYQDHPEFRKQLDPFHPDLATFMAKAMRVFADRELK